MTYQTFPWEIGDSSSFEKLQALHLPNLRKKSFLDVGCNLGFFCGYAYFQKASYVVGVDSNASCIKQAKLFFPECHFLCIDWKNLDDKKFDIILFISAIHYANDQQEMLDYLMKRLKPRGILVLELGIADGSTNSFIKVQRSIDTRFFPTHAKVEEMLEPYAYKYIGKSIKQIGDPICRHVYHIYHKLPIAALLLDEHYSGKSATSRKLFNSSIQYFSGDAFIYNLYKENNEIFKDIFAIAKCDDAINCALFVTLICKNNLLQKFLEMILCQTQRKDTVFDMYVPYKFREKIKLFFDYNNFFVVNISIHDATLHTKEKISIDNSVYKKYFEYLNNNYLIDETHYLETNPDVAIAISKGQIPSAQYHYWNFGRFENRKFRIISKKLMN